MNRHSEGKEWKVDLSFVVLHFFNTFVVFRTRGVARWTNRPKYQGVEFDEWSVKIIKYNNLYL